MRFQRFKLRIALRHVFFLIAAVALLLTIGRYYTSSFRCSMFATVSRDWVWPPARLEVDANALDADLDSERKALLSRQVIDPVIDELQLGPAMRRRITSGIRLERVGTSDHLRVSIDGNRMFGDDPELFKGILERVLVNYAARRNAKLRWNQPGYVQLLNSAEIMFMPVVHRNRIASYMRERLNAWGQTLKIDFLTSPTAG